MCHHSRFSVSPQGALGPDQGHYPRTQPAGPPGPPEGGGRVEDASRTPPERTQEGTGGTGGGAEAAAKRIARTLAELTVPEPAIRALHEAWPALVDTETLLAVRSSATAEDRAEASFAGQYSSLLDVYGLEAIQAAIVACWRSFFSPNALIARATHSALGDSERMAVLIQPMVNAECAGVCFSVDPVQHRRDQVVVNAAWGLGAGVADGTVAADTAWVRRADFHLDKQQVVEKEEQIRLDPAGGLQRLTLPADHRRSACLPESWLQRIAQFGVAAEVLLARPQDIEWAIADGQIWVLQSRPITALPPELAQRPSFAVTWENEEDRRHLWTRIQPDGQESAILLPLEQDHWATVESTREETCRFMGAERNRKLKFCQGRGYSRPIPIDWMAGDRRIRRAAMADLKDRLHNEGLTAWDYWGPEIVKATERLGAFDPAGAAGPTLADHLEDALAVRRRHYMLHPLCWFKPRPSFFDAFAAVSGLPEAEAEAMAYRLLEGEETTLTKIIDGLYDLAYIARQDPRLTALVVEDTSRGGADPPTDIISQLDRLLPQGTTFRAQFDDFLAIYGARTGDGYGSETTLGTPTWQEQPVQVLRLIAPYLDPKVESPAVVRSHAQQAREARLEALCDACQDKEIVAEFRRQLSYARKAYTVLEEHNHYIDQLGTGQLRQAVMAAARWLVAQGALTTQDDVLWLRFDEILTALRAPEPSSFVATVVERQAQYREWAKLEAPPILGTPEATLPARPPLQDEVTSERPADPNHLTGQGASPGRHRGRARVMTSAASLPDLSPGDVLVAWNVGPRWTPIFPILGGLVLDSGSLGQHAAATAREYGVPAVIGAKYATRCIPDGAWVTVDGAAGTVEIDDSYQQGKQL